MNIADEITELNDINHCGFALVQLGIVAFV